MNRRSWQKFAAESPWPRLSPKKAEPRQSYGASPGQHNSLGHPCLFHLRSLAGVWAGSFSCLSGVASFLSRRILSHQVQSPGRLTNMCSRCRYCVSYLLRAWRDYLQVGTNGCGERASNAERRRSLREDLSSWRMAPSLQGGRLQAKDLPRKRLPWVRNGWGQPR